MAHIFIKILKLGQGPILSHFKLISSTPGPTLFPFSSSSFSVLSFLSSFHLCQHRRPSTIGFPITCALLAWNPSTKDSYHRASTLAAITSFWLSPKFFNQSDAASQPFFSLAASMGSPHLALQESRPTPLSMLSLRHWTPMTQNPRMAMDFVYFWRALWVSSIFSRNRDHYDY